MILLELNHIAFYRLYTCAVRHHSQSTHQGMVQAPAPTIKAAARQILSSPPHRRFQPACPPVWFTGIFLFEYIAILIY
ncbi:hypothetical protein K443DRAFT_596619 [Laccaria amethystina LaAM-08-1]|uniref:Uncharacterized protein n=1 Tax=Laccaria amethystina LaAM-08-1 TaxID=1095629 RepID=A0A0C9XY16_9AGAR|nr:hypothetical protein K443DRAFT_596619 [Laccaria amethystina LaAM-08-1]